MTAKQIVLGIVAAVFISGAYFFGLLQGQQRPVKWRELFRTLTAPLTRKGLIWSVSLPALWIVLYYAFIARVWFSLGRWPRFGERLDGWLSFHHELNRYFFAALVRSLYLVPIILIAVLSIRKWRHVSVYAVCYAAGVGLSSCALFLAPHAFLNWLFD
jgi:hypothetical protein